MFMDRGIEIGFAEGIEKGKAEGETKGKVELIPLILDQAFQDCPIISTKADSLS